MAHVSLRAVLVGALGASALSRDQHTGTSALDMIVRLGVQRGQLHFGVSGGDDAGEQQHACQQEEANQPQQGRPLLTAWSQTVASLVEQGADPLHAPRRGHAPIHYFLAYVPLHDWPPIVRSTLLEAVLRLWQVHFAPAGGVPPTDRAALLRRGTRRTSVYSQTSM